MTRVLCFWRWGEMAFYGPGQILEMPSAVAEIFTDE